MLSQKISKEKMSELKTKKHKKIVGKVKLNLPAGKATPAPPVGPALGQYGVPLMDFCKEFNAKTGNMGDFVIPVKLVVYEDRTYKFETKTPLTTDLIMKELGIKKGSPVPNKQKIGKISRAQLEKIAEVKMKDLNTQNMEQAVKIIAGSARAMGVEVEL